MITNKLKMDENETETVSTGTRLPVLAHLLELLAFSSRFSVIISKLSVLFTAVSIPSSVGVCVCVCVCVCV